MLSVAVLGPVALRRDGTALPVPAGKTTELLVRLALEAGTAVGAERLIEDLWEGAAVGVARNTLQAKVSNLRRALGDRELLTGGPAGYALAVDPAGVDAVEALRLPAAVAALRATGDLRAARDESASGLSLFGADLLPGAAGAAWAEPFRARLADCRQELLEHHLAARVELGDDATADLAAAVERQPLREELWRLLVLALYRAGRQADALAALRRVRRLLADELGVDPGPALRELEQGILRQDSTLEPAQRFPGNLPPTSALVGRGPERDRLAALLRTHRLVTLTGPAGVGKTRLALEVAGAEPRTGGSWLARLEGARDAESVWRAVGAAFGLGEAGEAGVLERLGGAGTLLVLDNCEHLAGLLEGPVTRILATAPGSRVLATSQVPLCVDGEAILPLEPLPLADAVALFAVRAAARRPGFVLDAAAETVVAALCGSLDRLPLAIELAAARTKALPVAEIARRVDDRFTLLADAAGRRPARHRTLEAAIRWSYDLLFPDDQRGLWALAAFPGGASLPAAEHVLAALDVPAAAALDVLDRLADRSLLEVDLTPGGGVRYRLLDSVRAFARDRLAEAGPADVADAALAGWLAAAADRARDGVHGPDQPEHLQLGRSERANVDAALAWAAARSPALGSRIALGLGWVWAMLGSGADGAQRLRAALAADPGCSADDRAAGLLTASWLEAAGGDLDRAGADVQAALAAGPGTAVRAAAPVYLAFVRTQQGRPAEVLQLVEAARPELAGAGLAWEEGASRLLAAWAATALGRTAQARAACDEALDRLGELGDRWGVVHGEALLGGLAQAEHRFADAAGHHGRAAEAAEHLGFAAAAALHLANLGRTRQQLADPAGAESALRQAIDAGTAAGDLRVAALARVRLGRTLRAAGRPAEARAALVAALGWYAAAGGGDAHSQAAALLAALDGDTASLSTLAGDASGPADEETRLIALDALARLRAERGDPDGARAALAEADALLPAVAHLVSPADRTDADAARPLL